MNGNFSDQARERQLELIEAELDQIEAMDLRSSEQTRQAREEIVLAELARIGRWQREH